MAVGRENQDRSQQNGIRRRDHRQVFGPDQAEAAQILGSVESIASTTADIVTIEAVSIIQPENHPTTLFPRIFAQL